MPAPPWHVAAGIDATVDGWLRSGYVRPCLAADRAFAPTDGRAVPLPASLHPGLARALGERGVTELYAHQAEAYELALARRHFVVATPTASGKSLCFHLPILQTLAHDRDARALFLFPTKALARDQEANLGEMIAAADIGVPRIVYDGDTPGDARKRARDQGAIIMTNPDMLSAGILPHHPKWARLFQGLRYVVLDEVHTYRGVFGSHMANVIARLVRIARFHGANPTFLCATATIGNPRDHAARLLGVTPDEVALLDQSGAPRSERRVFIFNPPVVNAELGIRASYLKSAVLLASDLIEKKVPTIVFGASRNAVEIMLKYLRDRLVGKIDEGAVMAYRGGYLPETRRQIERDLRDGKVLGVVATSALELGIDIGSLDAVICAGYPGSIAATWQRFGRAGRRSGGSIAVLVASSGAVDQYFARDPESLLGAPAEEARIDPANVEIVLQHLKCAAFELPFVSREGSPGDAERYGALGEDDTRGALRFLGRHGVVHEADGRFHWSADAYPANHVSLRSVGWDNFVIVDRKMGRVIAELDWRSTHTMLHVQAIYQHEAETYQVEELDFENHKAYVKKIDVDYFTTAMVNRVVSVIEETESRDVGRCTLSWGEVSVVEKVVGYKKIKFHTHENTGYGDVRLPDMQMHTTSFWITVPRALFADVGRATAIDALSGLGRALETVATIVLMCEPRDIGQTIGDKNAPPPAAFDDPPSASSDDPGRSPLRASPRSASPSRLPARIEFDPTLFLFDHVPGGVGLAERIYEIAQRLLVQTATMIAACPCDSGCPACVGPTETDGGRKATALLLLARLTGGEAPLYRPVVSSPRSCDASLSSGGSRSSQAASPRDRPSTFGR
ncbi:MAG: DEAD/DEAH box helicase [Polyangiaceae bacterium]